MSDPTIRLNAALGGRYHVERQIGEGGMATVFLAEDLRHERKVAFKVLKSELAAVVGGERFLAEIKTTANLQHPHILPLFDSGEADSLVYYVMPYVQGESLRRTIARQQQLQVDEAVTIAVKVAGALHAAHERGVIHRDIKPGNILLSRGEPLVADFGIALAIGTAGTGRVTETGLSLGTPHYMSPEQATGERVVGPQSDIYSLGCVLYEMLAGEPPHRGGTMQSILGRIVRGDAEPVTNLRRSVPTNVDYAIRKALEKVPADRFETAADFAQALRDPRFGEDKAAKERQVYVGVWNPLSIAMTALAALLAIIVGFTQTRPAPPTPGVERFESPFRVGQEPVYFSPTEFALSPDGALLVYSGPASDGREAQLWVRRWDDAAASPIPNTVGAYEPSVSPTGTEVAVRQSGRIVVVDIDQGPVRTLATGGGQPYWATDGYVYYTVLSQGSLTADLMRVPSTGGPSELVFEGTPDDDTPRGIFGVHPDGDVILLRAQDEIRALDRRTGTEVPLGTGESAAYASTGHLLVVDGGAFRATPIDPSWKTLTGPSITLMQGVGHITLSNTGKLAYSEGPLATNRRLTQLVWVDRTGAVTPVDDEWTFDSGSGNVGWSLSPDGTRIAVSQRIDGNNDVWVRELQARTDGRVTYSERRDGVPFWTPDGERVSYMGLGRDGGVWTRRADGAGDAELVLDGTHHFAQGVWSPDGVWMLLRPYVVNMDQTTVANRDILAYRPGIDDEPQPLVATSEFAEQGAALSQDGSWLAYVSNETGRDEVYVTPFPDVNASKHRVSTNGGFTTLWGRSGQELFYVDANEDFVAVRYSTEPSFRTLSEEVLFSLRDIGNYIALPGLSTIDVDVDDQRFLMGRVLGAAPQLDGEGAHLVLVNNFDLELRSRVAPR